MSTIGRYVTNGRHKADGWFEEMDYMSIMENILNTSKNLSKLLVSLAFYICIPMNCTVTDHL